MHPLLPRLKVSQEPLKEVEIHVPVDSQMPAGQLVLGVLCVSKNGLFLNLMAPNSVSAFGWEGSCS